MIFLDTDHLSILTNRAAAGHASLLSRLENSADVPAVPIVCVEEQCKGWLARIHRARAVHQQIPAYERLTELFQFFAEWEIVCLETAAADVFDQLRRQKIRIGSQDLKIAAIALTHDALLLSANPARFPSRSRPARGKLAGIAVPAHPPAVAWAAGHGRGVGEGGVPGSATTSVLPSGNLI